MLQATHAIAGMEGSDNRAGASDFVKYVFRPRSVDEQFRPDGMTIVQLLEGMEATTIPLASVRAYMEAHNVPEG